MASKLILKNLENTELTIAHRDGNLAKLIYSDELAVSVATVALMEAIATPDDGATCIVKDLDRGGIFVYDSSLVGSDNQGTNFSGWIRQYSGSVNVKWFGGTETGLNNAITYADVNRKILYLGNDNISVTSDVIFPNTLEVYQGSRGAIIGNGTNSVIIDNADSSNGKKKTLGTITLMLNALVVRGSINNIEFHTLSNSTNGLVIESLTNLSSDRSLDNNIKGVQIGDVTNAIVFQQYADNTVQQGNEIIMNFLSGFTNGVIFKDNAAHTQAGDWDSNYIETQAMDSVKPSSSFIKNDTAFPVSNLTIYSHSWNGGLADANSRCITGAFRGCDFKIITAFSTTADNICSLADSTAISTCKLSIKRGTNRISTTAGEMFTAISTQVLADFNGGVLIQSNSFLLDCTLPASLNADTSARMFFFHPLAHSIENNPFSVKAFNEVTLRSVDSTLSVSTSTSGDRGMVSVWIYNKSGVGIPASANFKFIIDVA